MTSQHFKNEADGWGGWEDWNSNTTAQGNINNVNNHNNNIVDSSIQYQPQPPNPNPNHNFNFVNQPANQSNFQNHDFPSRPPQFAPPANTPIYSPFEYQPYINQPNNFLHGSQNTSM